MSDDQQGTPRPHDETQPVRPEGATALPPAPEPRSAAVTDPTPAASSGRRGFGERFRSLRGADGSRTFGLAALIASALAGIIVGGLGVTAVHAITHDGPGDRGGWMQRRDDRGPGIDGDGGMHGGPRGVPGQVPPTTPPEDDDSSNS
jgi:hypothetical protein